MDIKKQIVEHLVEVLDGLKGTLEKDEIILEYCKEEFKFEELFEAQRRLLIAYVEAKDKENFSDVECLKFYKEYRIPYVVIVRTLKLMKQEIVSLMEGDALAEIVVQTHSFINKIIDSISKIYIKKDIASLNQMRKDKFRNYMLFKPHVAWIDKIVESISSDDLDKFPIVTHSNCEFSRLLNYPEALLVCMDVNLCTYLHTIHKLLHDCSNTFFRFYHKGEYAQAYLMFKDLQEHAQKFFSILKDLYYMTHSDLEGSFFKLVEMLCSTSQTQIVTLFDVEGLKKLNSLHGEKRLNSLLALVHKTLEEQVDKHNDNSLVIRGISANFYMLNLNWDPKDLRVFLDKVRGKIKEELRTNFEDIDINCISASLEVNSLHCYQRDELIRVLLHLKEIARDIETKEYMAFGKEQRDKIRQWQKDKLYNVSFITQKLKYKEIDVVFQPIISNSDGEIVAVEALARIVDAQKLIPAGIFIDTIIDIGKVVTLDSIVLDRVLEKKDRILNICDKVYINTAAQSLMDVHFRQKLHAFVESFGVENIVIEITEQQAIGNIDIVRKLHKETGARFAIDDFGSGYTALKTVADLVYEGTIDILKVDGELIRNLDSQKQMQNIVEVIVQMCQTMNIVCLAEFVESKESLRILKNFGAHFSQGYLFSTPRRVEELLTIDMKDRFLELLL